MQLSQFITLAALATTLTAAARDARVKKNQKQHMLNSENQKQTWGRNEVFTGTCSRDSEKPCPRCKIVQKTATCSDYADRTQEKVNVTTFPIRVATQKENLPEVMQGVFWLTDQGDKSALVSFAQGEDGGGFGKLDDNGTFKIRVGLGDRVWSLHDTPGLDVAANKDWFYTFHFDSRGEPRHAKIYGEAANSNIKFGFGAASYWLGMLRFDMDLIDCSSKDHGNLCNKFKGSVIWQRTSKVFGFNLKAGTYQAVQVIKPDGTKLDAFYQWVEYCKHPDQGKTPGQFHYHEINNDKACP